MKYDQLDSVKRQTKKRVGRGISAGGGKTAGRGTKGQNSRTGKKLRGTFMGGQGALVQRIPKKKGFTSLRAPAQVVYSDELALMKAKTADNHGLFEAGLIASPYHSVKVIAREPLTAKVTLKVQAASASVIAMIEKAGGSFEAVPVPLKESTKKK